MAWRDSLRRVRLADGRELIGASFRGAPFLVESAERSGGRRTVTHEFPLRDDPVVDDLGRRARVFLVEGYVLGDDYLTARNALLVALEDVAGPGELVHPYYGTRRVVCSSLTTRESIADGGMARFSIEFTEAPAAVVAPVEAPDLAAEVETSAAAARTAAQAQLLEDYDTSGQPGYAVTSLAAEIDAVADQLGEALAELVAATQELAALDVEIRSITSNTISLARDPAETIAAFVAVLEAVAETAADSPRRFIAALLEAYDVDPQPLVTGDSVTRTLERTNQQALAAALRQVLVIEAARLLPSVVFPTLDEATAERDAVADRLEEQAETAGDTVYPLLVQLRANVLRAVPGDAALARVVTVDRATAIPSLLLAYQLYGSVDREQDIIDRNAAAHPGFMSGELQVLSDG